MGAVDGLGTRADRFSAVAHRRRRSHDRPDRGACRAGRFRSSPRTSRQRGLVPTVRTEPAGRRRRRSCTPGLLRIGDNGCGRGVADGGDRGAAACDRRRRRRTCVGHCLQDRARSCREARDCLRAYVLRHRPNTRPAALRPRRRREGDRDQRLRSRLHGAAHVGVRRESEGCRGCRRSRSADASAAHGWPWRITLPRRRSRRWSFRVIPTTRARFASLSPSSPNRTRLSTSAGRHLARSCPSVYGEVQEEVIGDAASELGLEVTFRETTTICVERPIGSGEAVEILEPSRIRSRHGWTARRASAGRLGNAITGSRLTVAPSRSSSTRRPTASRST